MAEGSSGHIVVVPQGARASGGPGKDPARIGTGAAARSVTAMLFVLACLGGITGSALLVIFHFDGPELWPMPLGAIAIAVGTALVWVVLSAIEKLMDRIYDSGTPP